MCVEPFDCAVGKHGGAVSKHIFVNDGTAVVQRAMVGLACTQEAEE